MPTSRGGSNIPPNCEPLDAMVHSSLHNLFSNQHTLEKVDSIIQMDARILQDKYKYILMEILATDPTDVFISEAFKSKSEYKRVGDTVPAHYGVMRAKQKNIHKRINAKNVLFGEDSDTLEKMSTIVGMDEIVLSKHFRDEIFRILNFSPKEVFSKHYLDGGRESYGWWKKH